MKRLEWLFHIIAFALQCGGIVLVFLRTGSDSADPPRLSESRAGVSFYSEHIMSAVNRRVRSTSSVMGSTTDESPVW